MVDGLYALHRPGEHRRVAGVAVHGVGGPQRLQRLEVARSPQGADLLPGLRQQRDEPLALISVGGGDKYHGDLPVVGLAAVGGLAYKAGRIHIMPSAL